MLFIYHVIKCSYQTIHIYNNGSNRQLLNTHDGSTSFTRLSLLLVHRSERMGGGTGEGEPWERTLQNLRPLQRYLSLIFPHPMR